MLTIKENIVSEVIINKSKFITYLYKINNEEDAKKIINDLWDEHKTATHICTSYIIENIVRCNDDGEPSGTAGKPILNVLENNNIDYVLCCIVRYFGGIKLGAGGLIRAYSKCTSEALKCATLINLLDGFKIKILLSYDTIKLVERMDINIINKSFNDSIIYTVLVKPDKLKELSNLGEIISKENAKIYE